MNEQRVHLICMDLGRERDRESSQDEDCFERVSLAYERILQYSVLGLVWEISF